MATQNPDTLLIKSSMMNLNRRCIYESSHKSCTGEILRNYKNLTNHRMYLKKRVLVFDSLVRRRLPYSCQKWNGNQTRMNIINFVYIWMLRKLVWNDSKTKDFKYVITNEEIIKICHTEYNHKFVERQQVSYLANLARQTNSCLQ